MGCRPLRKSSSPFTVLLKVQSNEYDLLLIRLHSLLNIVDKHIILLSNTTFTGLPMIAQLPSHTPLTPSPSLPDDLVQFKDKLYVYHHPTRPIQKGEDPFILEGERRAAMNEYINAISPSSSISPLIVMSDLDEIPTKEALDLVKTCDAPSPIHLQLDQYLYSFEWYVGRQSWRAAVVQWDEGGDGVGYGHGKKGEVMLGSAGVHCRCGLFLFPLLCSVFRLPSPVSCLPSPVSCPPSVLGFPYSAIPLSSRFFPLLSSVSLFISSLFPLSSARLPLSFSLSAMSFRCGVFPLPSS